MEQDNGFIGDIKYSILEPGKFEIYHPGWKLLKGQTIPVDSGLGKEGITELPDARGVFLRGMHEKRDDGKGDSDISRYVGSFQEDAIKKHSHNLSNEIGYFGGWGGSNLFSGGTPGNPMSIGNDGKTPVSVLDYGRNLNAEETRPKNIAIYIYIKIF
jgi:hypothetical protein